jgi:hypothetical protein
VEVFLVEVVLVEEEEVVLVEEEEVVLVEEEEVVLVEEEEVVVPSPVGIHHLALRGTECFWHPSCRRSILDECVPVH